MKKIVLAISVAIFALGVASPALAHSGRTDANGGHTCKTNCEKYELKYGQYHMHGTSSSRNTSKKVAPKQVKTKAKVTSKSMANRKQ